VQHLLSTLNELYNTCSMVIVLYIEVFFLSFLKIFMLCHVALSWLGKIENRVKLAFNVLHVLIQRRPHL